MLDVQKVRSDFPILNEKINGFPLVYLDNAATTQKPYVVIETISDYYIRYNSNVHRGIHSLSQLATDKYEQARQKVKDFISAKYSEEIIFTKNDTEGINIIAQSYGGANLKEGDEIILSALEHHSNIVPWQLIAKKTGAKIRFAKIKDNLELDYDHFDSLLSTRTKIVALSHGSNVTGEIIDFGKIIYKAHNVGAVVIVDAGQTAGHYLVDLNTTLKDVDFVSFSSHKLYGPTGIGILYGRKELLEKMEPTDGGGDMIKEVFEDFATWNDLPYKFEAGTPNIADAIGFGAAIDYLKSFNPLDITEYENRLTKYTKERLLELDFIDLFSPADIDQYLPIVSFNIKGVHPHDVGTLLDNKGIAIRTGHHCTQPLMKTINQVATARASMAMYNTKEEIDLLVQTLKEINTMFKI